jgi:hypothetical protein
MSDRVTGKLEAEVRDPVVKWAKANGVLHERNHKGRGAGTGWPDDRFYFGQGRTYLVEFKRERNGRTTKRQELIIQLLRDAGHDVDIHNDTDKALAAIRTRLEAFGRAIPRGRIPHP